MEENKNEKQVVKISDNDVEHYTKKLKHLKKAKVVSIAIAGIGLGAGVAGGSLAAITNSKNKELVQEINNVKEERDEAEKDKEDLKEEKESLEIQIEQYVSKIYQLETQVELLHKKSEEAETKMAEAIAAKEAAEKAREEAEAAKAEAEAAAAAAEEKAAAAEAEAEAAKKAKEAAEEKAAEAEEKAAAAEAEAEAAEKAREEAEAALETAKKDLEDKTAELTAEQNKIVVTCIPDGAGQSDVTFKKIDPNTSLGTLPTKEGYKWVSYFDEDVEVTASTKISTSVIIKEVALVALDSTKLSLMVDNQGGIMPISSGGTNIGLDEKNEIWVKTDKGCGDIKEVTWELSDETNFKLSSENDGHPYNCYITMIKQCTTEADLKCTITGRKSGSEVVIPIKIGPIQKLSITGVPTQTTIGQASQFRLYYGSENITKNIAADVWAQLPAGAGITHNAGDDYATMIPTEITAAGEPHVLSFKYSCGYDRTVTVEAKVDVVA